MQTRWMMTEFFRDENDMLRPVCSAYGSRWRCPQNPATDEGVALVEMYCAPQQVEAAAEDPRIVVCPRVFDPAAVPAAVVDAYADRGAIAGMNMGALLAVLSDQEPGYAMDF